MLETCGDDPVSAVVVDDVETTASAELVVIRSIEFSGFSGKSPLPYLGAVHIAYVPAGRAVAGGDAAQLVAALSRRCLTQEALTRKIHDALEQRLAPGAMLVVVEGRHSRSGDAGHGGRAPVVTTRAISGQFKDSAARAAAMRIVRRGRTRTS